MATSLFILHERSRALWFYTGDPVCVHCAKECSHVAYYVSDWNTQRPVHGLLCDHCAKEAMRLNRGSQEFRLVRLVSEIPLGAIPCFLSHHGFVSSQASVFDLATKPFRDETVVDRTKYAGRPGYTLDGEGEFLVGKDLSLLESERAWKRDPAALLAFHLDEQNILLPGKHNEQRLIE